MPEKSRPGHKSWYIRRWRTIFKIWWLSKDDSWGFAVRTEHTHTKISTKEWKWRIKNGEYQMTHELKTWPEYFNQILIGNKTFEIRENDRNFQIGDELILREWDPEKKEYTPQMTTKKVTWIAYGPEWGIKLGHCVMALNSINFVEWDKSIEKD